MVGVAVVIPIAVFVVSFVLEVLLESMTLTVEEGSVEPPDVILGRLASGEVGADGGRWLYDDGSVEGGGGGGVETRLMAS